MNFDFSFVAFQCSGSIVIIFEKNAGPEKNIVLHMGKEIPGRDTQKFWWGCLAQTFKSVPQIRPKSLIFHTLFSDPRQNKHCLFQTSKVSEMRPFGTVALIVCVRDKQKKKSENFLCLRIL